MHGNVLKAAFVVWHLGRRAARPGLIVAAMALSVCGRPAWAVSTLVNFDTTKGQIQVDLFGEVTPLTVANFLQYVNSGAYTNTVVHRTAAINGSWPFVVQGGGYTLSSFTQAPLPAFPTHITQLPAVQNEFKISNTRGTIAMAKLGSNPNSATTEWFFNLDDRNATTLPGPALDTQNGGFTVFGNVVGGSISVADAIMALPTFTVPFTAGGISSVPKDGSNFVSVNSITVIREHAAFQNPISDVDVNNDGLLTNADALAIINSLIDHNVHAANQFVGNSYKYLDTSGNNTVAPQDALKVINALIAHGTGGPAPVTPTVAFLADASPLASPAVAAVSLAVPEPSSIGLALSGAAALGGWAVRRRKASRRRQVQGR